MLKQTGDRISFGGFEFMRRRKTQTHITENYVATPPALHIDDTRGDRWTLGFEKTLSRGRFAFDVRRNGHRVGETANSIEMRNGRISIFGPEGRKTWNGRTFV